MAKGVRKPRPNVWSDSYRPYGSPPPGVKGDPDSWAAAFRQRIGQDPTVIEEILGDDDPWAVLGISKGATEDDVKAAYRRKARETHPDVGGSQAAFERIQAAYEKLRGK